MDAFAKSTFTYMYAINMRTFTANATIKSVELNTGIHLLIAIASKRLRLLAVY